MTISPDNALTHEELSQLTSLYRKVRNAVRAICPPQTLDLAGLLDPRQALLVLDLDGDLVREILVSEIVRDPAALKEEAAKALSLLTEDERREVLVASSAVTVVPSVGATGVFGITIYGGSYDALWVPFFQGDTELTDHPDPLRLDAILGEADSPADALRRLRDAGITVLGGV